MLNLTWKLFSETGSIDSYLLFKELEREHEVDPLEFEEELAEVDFPVT